ncbi:tail fiber assembly protein [Pseudomonas fluorescens]|uniref:tail fiber assembly protein n=1 Tax=Pseudomonas fluorescens TaxID=294 RepID=UPI0007D091EC|nr:tail fiber assembly protein [Pseudomonas fluorescens]
MNYLIDRSGALIGPVEFPVIPGFGTQLPGNAVELDTELPPASEGQAWGWTDEGPQELPDQRGTVYKIDSGESQEWVLLGELPSGITTQPKPGRYYVWLEDAWRLDKSAELEGVTKDAQAKRSALMAYAGSQIAPLQDAVDLKLATDVEKALYDAWRLYRVLLNRVEQQEGFPSDINWPVQPG